MNVAQRPIPAERARWRLTPPQAWRLAMWLVPVFFGLVALSMRQDINWDLRNYHLYNPFAWLNGKVGLDLAPAQMQTYFNPTIDLLYYGLISIFPPRVSGFIMGTIHGLNFVLLATIAREVLGPHPAGRQRLPLWLAFAGLLGVGFIAQIGNTMGDNLTALFVLGAVLLVLRHWRAVTRGEGAATLLLAGVVMGLGIGLKPTNGIYAPALCLALLLVPASAPCRIRAAFLFGVGVLAGVAASAGHWYWKMWTLFGNPLFPQFNNIFHSPMAAPVGVADLRFLPHGLIEKAFWPFIFAIDSARVSEIKLSMVVWPVLYVAVIAVAVVACVKAARRPAAIAVPPNLSNPVDRSRDNALLLFLALAYLAWMNMFSIARYLVPLELLAPLIIWMAAQRIFPRAVAGKVATCIILVIVGLSLHSKNWGRSGWGQQAFSAEAQAIDDPAHSIIFTTHVDPPMGWIATFYPANVAFVSLASGFESAGYVQRLEAMKAGRHAAMYVMLSDSGATVEPRMEAERKQQGREADAAINVEAGRLLAAHGMQFSSGTCVMHPAHIGDHLMHYRLCPVAQTRVPG